MSFLEFFVRNAEYTNLSSMWGLYRVLLWLIVKLLAKICNAVENIYKHILSLFGVIYSEPVVKFFQGWITYLWIPIAISILILAYNLILGDSEQGNVKLKAFARNLSLLAIVLFGLPYLFIGHSSSNASGVFVDSSASYYNESSDTYGKLSYEVDGLYGSDVGLVDLFVNDDGKGLINGISALSGTEDKSYAYTIVANNVYDLKEIFLYCAENLSKDNFTKTWSRDMLESGKVPKNTYLVKKSDGTYGGTTNNEIMSVDVAESEDYDYWDDDYNNKKMKNKTLDDFSAEGYDKYANQISYSMFWANRMGRQFASEEEATNFLKEEYEKGTKNTDIEAVLFMNILKSGTTKYSSDGHIESFGFGNNGETEASLPFGWEIKFLNSELFRYHIEWGILFVQLISMILVLLLTSYKIAKIIYEIIFNHFLAIFYGAADLSNGQRIKEVLQSIVNLILSIIFAVISVELYLIITESINTVTFIPDDPSLNKWMIALVDFFLAMAVIKGPSVLEKILGIEGGLHGAFRDMSMAALTAGAATRTASRTAGMVGRGAMKLAHGGAAVAKGASKRGYYLAQKHKGKKDANKENENGNQYEIGGRRDKSRKEVAGNESQFGAISGKKEKGLTKEQKEQGADGRRASNVEMARQGRDISAEMKHKVESQRNASEVFDNEPPNMESINSSVSNEIANRYRGNIQNAALAEKARAKQNGEDISDKEALARAYESSGFSSEQANSLASRDVTGGSFAEKQEKFENSISAKAQQNLTDSPLSYNNKMDAYKEAATEHYKELGFDSETASNMATDTANRVLVDDSQQLIRERAAEIQRTIPSSSHIEKGGSKSDVINDENRMSDVEALRKATSDVLGASGSSGFTGDINKAANYIYSQGTLREGVVSGRIAHNTVREHTQTNTRAGSLRANEETSFVETKAALWGGYKTKRGLDTLSSTGYDRGVTVNERKRSRKTEKQYSKLKRERKKGSKKKEEE